jgi:hypothetical protein
METYTYSINQTLNNKINTGSLWQTIKDSPIIPNIHSVIFENSQITINFISELVNSEVVLLATIISEHDGNPITE